MMKKSFKAILGIALVLVTLISVSCTDMSADNLGDDKSYGEDIEDLSEVDLSEVDLSEVDLSEVDLNVNVFDVLACTKDLIEVRLTYHFYCDLTCNNLDPYYEAKMVKIILPNIINAVVAEMSSDNICLVYIENDVLTILDEQYSAYVENCHFTPIHVEVTHSLEAQRIISKIPSARPKTPQPIWWTTLIHRF